MKKIYSDRKFIYNPIFHYIILSLCIITIVIIKFTPLNHTHTSEISFLKWYPYGEETGEVFFNLSMAYIASAIFSFIVISLPAKKKEKEAATILTPGLKILQERMAITINYFFMKTSLNEQSDINLIQEKLEQLNTFEDKPMNFFYQIQDGSNKFVDCHTGDYTELKYLLVQSKLIKSEISSLYEIPVTYYLNYEMKILLEEIRRLKLFRTVESIEKYKDNIQTPELGKHLYDYYFIYTRLSKFIGKPVITFNQNVDAAWSDIDIDIDIDLQLRQHRTFNH